MSPANNAEQNLPPFTPRSPEYGPPRVLLYVDIRSISEQGAVCVRARVLRRRVLLSKPSISEQHVRSDLGQGAL